MGCESTSRSVTELKIRGRLANRAERRSALARARPSRSRPPSVGLLVVNTSGLPVSFPEALRSDTEPPAAILARLRKKEADRGSAHVHADHVIPGMADPALQENRLSLLRIAKKRRQPP